MNTYNDNELVTVKGILTNIANEHTKQDSAKTVAQYNLYFAVGSQLLAQDKFDEANTEFKATLDINDQGVACSNRANNLLGSAQLADQNVTAVVTNTATVAQNVQAAVNSILQLAANIGSANNIVSASEYDTDIQRMTWQVNKVINDTAYQAELISQYAMESSTQASQIIAKQVFQEATLTKTWFDDMLKRTQAELDKLTSARITDTNKLVSANSAQRAAEGVLYGTQEECTALVNAYIVTNHDLNFELTANVKSISEIGISFKEFKPPFGPPANPGGNQAADNCNGFPPPNYYITVVRSDVKDMFSYDVAETTFNSYKGSTKDRRFYPVKAGINNPVTLGDKGNLNMDAYGQPIKPGIAYVAILYIELDIIYKKALNDYDDIISAASNLFVLTTTLNKFIACDSLNSGTVIQFQGPMGTQDPDFAEHRCILLPAHSLCSNECPADRTHDSSDIWFDLDIATQVSADNYTLAHKTVTPKIPPIYEVKLVGEPTDCFGKLLVEKGEYIPAILSIVPNSVPSSNSFTPTLSKLPQFTWQPENSPA